MEIKVLELGQYVAKYHERPQPGCRYLAEGSLIYRCRGAQAEDMAEVPPGVACTSVPPMAVPAGQYIGEPEAIARLREVVMQMEGLSLELENILRS
jgi:hypothetical protein